MPLLIDQSRFISHVIPKGMLIRIALQTGGMSALSGSLRKIDNFPGRTIIHKIIHNLASHWNLV
jgi:hypothetical protein